MMPFATIERTDGGRGRRGATGERKGSVKGREKRGEEKRRVTVCLNKFQVLLIYSLRYQVNGIDV